MLPKAPPSHAVSWDIVRAGARIEFLGSVEATDERDAIEKAAKEFKNGPRQTTRSDARLAQLSISKRCVRLSMTEM
jgi:hypothetical protein